MTSASTPLPDRDPGGSVAASAAPPAGYDRFRGTFEAAGIGMALLEPSGVVVEANTTLARFLGYESAAELAGVSVAGVTHPDDLGNDVALYGELLEGARDAYSLEKRYLRRDGEVAWGRLTVSLARDAEGRPTHAVALVEDVSAWKRRDQERAFLVGASELLASSLDYDGTLAAVTELAVDGLADWCMVDEWTPARGVRRVAIAHPDPEKVALGYRLYEKYPPDQEMEHGISRVLRTGEPELVPFIPEEWYTAIIPDPEYREIARELDLASYISVPLIARGETLGALTLVRGRASRGYGDHDLWLAEELARRAAVAMDNARLFQEAEEARAHAEESAIELEAQTEELQNQAAALEEAQVEIESANDELRAANRQLAERTAEAERANRAKSDFLATMSHELRTPLNAILGYSDLLLAGIPEPITEGPRQKVERIGLSARHLLGLIEEILSFSRLEAGEERVEIQRVQLRPVLDEVQALMEPLALQKGLRFECHAPVDLPPLESDARKIRQIIINLVGNAIKFTREGEVGVAVREIGDTMEVRVADTGPGIPPEHLERIFEPFWQVEHGMTRQEGGTGLGLTVSRRLARLIGGDLTVESEEGRGSEFVLTLPMHGG